MKLYLFDRGALAGIVAESKQQAWEMLITNLYQDLQELPRESVEKMPTLEEFAEIITSSVKVDVYKEFQFHGLIIKPEEFTEPTDLGAITWINGDETNE